VRRTIDLVRNVGPTCAGASLGVRVYPGTRLARDIHARGDPARRHLRGAVEGNPDLALPVFYTDAALGEDPETLVAECIGGDERFFFGGMVDAEADYNYNDNQVIADAISAGMRGAYWHILARLRGID
jgi:hypothetical protein